MKYLAIVLSVILGYSVRLYETSPNNKTYQCYNTGPFTCQVDTHRVVRLTGYDGASGFVVLVAIEAK